MIVVDRFEGEYAVFECDGEIVNVDRRLVSEEVSEGDCVVMSGIGKYVTDIEQTNARRRQISELFNKLIKE